ncbi:hypothetical protein [Pelagerythrobacter sp.]|uniref:hypothetical protein n=1 Tax=Pelagerythrobacter sp. TaxID=2800702 RepID=UPI0035AF9663
MATKHDGRAGQVPISRHPAFPAIVALWFAALLGIGTLVLPAHLFEAAIEASGISAVLPVAEPPLGVTARILIALVAAAIGVILGFVLARKVAAAQQDTRVPHRAPSAAPEAKRPISAHDELWSEGFDEPVADAPAALIPGRRRALSVTDEGGPSEFLGNGELPAEDTEIVMDDPQVAPPPIEMPAAEPIEDDTLELAVFADGEPFEASFDHAPPIAAEAPDEDVPAVVTGLVIPGPSISLDAARPFDGPAAASPADRLHSEFVAEPAPEFVPPLTEEAVVYDDDHTEVASEVSAQPEQEPPVPADEDHALGDLSIAELVERFALSLQRAAERATEAEAVQPPRYVPDLGVEAVEAPRFAAPDEPVAASPAEPADEPLSEVEEEPVATVPEALRPVAFEGEVAEDEDEAEDFALTLSLAPQPRPFDRPADPAPAAESAKEAGDAETDGGYSSLLSMRKQATNREFVRIDDELPTSDAPVDAAIEPVVVFPGHEQRHVSRAERSPETSVPEMADVQRPFAAPAHAGASGSDPMQTERALREALHKLQRLSGAA